MDEARHSKALDGLLRRKEYRWRHKGFKKIKKVIASCSEYGIIFLDERLSRRCIHPAFTSNVMDADDP